MKLTKEVVIKAANVEDAVSKMRKFVKRGAVECGVFSTDDIQRWFSQGLPLYLNVHTSGEVCYHNHSCQPAVVLKRVRDVENYRV